MSVAAYLRSLREIMDGWPHLPRYIDKIRPCLAGKLPPESQSPLGKQTDGLWLAAAGVTHEQMVEVVRGTLTDGQVCDWVRRNVRRTVEDKARAVDAIVNYPLPGDEAGQARFADRMRFYGLEGREEVHTRADLLDAGEGRLS